MNEDLWLAMLKILHILGSFYATLSFEEGLALVGGSSAHPQHQDNMKLLVDYVCKLISKRCEWNDVIDSALRTLSLSLRYRRMRQKLVKVRPIVEKVFKWIRHNGFYHSSNFCWKKERQKTML